MSASNDSGDATASVHSVTVASDANAAVDSTPASLSESAEEVFASSGPRDPSELLDETGPREFGPREWFGVPVPLAACEENTCALSGCASFARPRASRLYPSSRSPASALTAPAPASASVATKAAALAATATAARDGPCGVEYAGPCSIASRTHVAQSVAADSRAETSTASSPARAVNDSKPHTCATGSTPTRLELTNAFAIASIVGPASAIDKVLRVGAPAARLAKTLRTYLRSLASLSAIALFAAAVIAFKVPGVLASDSRDDGSSLRFTRHPTAACLSPTESDPSETRTFARKPGVDRSAFLPAAVSARFLAAPAAISLAAPGRGPPRSRARPGINPGAGASNPALAV